MGLASGTAFSVELPKENPKLETKEQKVAPTAFAGEKPKPIPGWGVGDGKSYLVPIVGIIGFDTLLNLSNRYFLDEDTYQTNFATFKKNITGGWVYDTDSFEINQFGHPYQGSMYHGFARSAGLGYWESSIYTALGSVFWEMAGETGAPSINDQITTGFGGSFLGESLFRMASLVLESGDGGKPGFWREVRAAALSPATGFNRWAYGDRFDGVFRSYNPAVYTRLQLGVNLSTNVRSNSAGAAVPPPSFQQGEAIADATIAYGLPGKPGYNYKRPFDYFQFQFTAATSNALENIISRGLVYGNAYELGKDYRGVWGLYGTYDYIAPQIFRISTTAANVGTTAQWWLSRTIALQGTALAGVGYGSGGTVRVAGQRDYHSGISPQGMLDLRAIFGDRVAIDFTARDYYITDLLSEQKGGRENIVRGEVSMTLRVFNLHGLVLKYALSRRDAQTRGLPNSHQSVNAISIGYAYLGQTHFGAVDWRPKSEGGPL